MILIKDNHNGSSIWNINKEHIEEWNLIELTDEDFKIIINTLDDHWEFYSEIKEFVSSLTGDLIFDGSINPIKKD
tara:strand:- start:13646 stop:13870 length:225 start_codon:yes stop_codon:yes gene_type:complete